MDEEFYNLYDKNRNKDFILKNRDGSELLCRIVYYPLDNYDPARACIQIKDTTDFREVPIRFLSPQQ